MKTCRNDYPPRLYPPYRWPRIYKSFADVFTSHKTVYSTTFVWCANKVSMRHYCNESIRVLRYSPPEMRDRSKQYFINRRFRYSWELRASRDGRMTRTHAVRVMVRKRRLTDVTVEEMQKKKKPWMKESKL